MLIFLFVCLFFNVLSLCITEFGEGGKKAHLLYWKKSFHISVLLFLDLLNKGNSYSQTRVDAHIQSEIFRMEKGKQVSEMSFLKLSDRKISASDVSAHEGSVFWSHHWRLRPIVLYKCTGRDNP